MVHPPTVGGSGVSKVLDVNCDVALLVVADGKRLIVEGAEV